MLDNHELKLFLISNYLINAIAPVFVFLDCDLKLKLSQISSIYAEVNLICEVIFIIKLQSNMTKVVKSNSLN